MSDEHIFSNFPLQHLRIENGHNPTGENNPDITILQIANNNIVTGQRLPDPILAFLSTQTSHSSAVE